MLIACLIIGYRNYKTYQLKECLSRINVGNVSSITTYINKKGIYDIVKSNTNIKKIDDNVFLEFIQMLQKHSYTFYMNDKDLSDHGYVIDENVTIEINTVHQESIILDISRNYEKGRILVLVSSNYLYNISSVYKLPKDEGIQLLNWINEQ